MGQSEASSFHIGVDENGLGPRLGPLVVTGVLARMRAGGRRALNQLRDAELAERVGDSKGLVSHGHIALAEAWARVLVGRGAGRLHGGQEALVACELSADALLHALSLDDRATLRAPCPAHVESQCWSSEHDGEASERVGELCAAVAADLQALARAGLEIVAVRSVISCSRRLNDAAREGRSRLLVDLESMERLVLELRALAGADVRAVCGKVGGYRAYGKVFGPLGDRLRTVIEETPARSAYRISGVGEVAFVRDADEADMLVGLASLVGKYLRELTMARIVSHYRADQPELPDASGYNDPVTTRFMAATASVRLQRSIPDECFQRFKLGELARD